jgi:hypothetical protein
LDPNSFAVLSDREYMALSVRWELAALTAGSRGVSGRFLESYRGG